MVELKREYVVPLRQKTKLAPKWRRSKKAISVLNDFIKKHMKTEDVIICKELNEKIWENGIKNPPGKVEVVALKKEFAGVEKTLVNLKDFGLDEQLSLYSAEVITSVAPAKKDTSKENKTSKVVDVEAKENKNVEVESNAETKEDLKEAKK